MGNYVITIGREFESLGRDVGLRLSEKLGIKCYDKELLSRAAKESGLCEEIFHSQDEKPTSSFLYSLVMDTYSATGYTAAPFLDMPLNHKIFLAQFNAIRKIAEEGACVIVGRCADYALADFPNLVSVFIHGDMECKVARIASEYQVSSAKAKEMIIKTDKRRASYYNYYSDKRWGDVSGYSLSVNSSVLGIDGTVRLLKDYVALREEKK